MVVEGWANLSLKKENLTRLKRMYDVTLGKEGWVEWVSNILESSLLREKFLKDNFTHIRFVGNVKDGCVLEDTKLKIVVNVTIKGSKITATPHKDEYVMYALLNPRLLFG